MSASVYVVMSSGSSASAGFFAAVRFCGFFLAFPLLFFRVTN